MMFEILRNQIVYPETETHMRLTKNTHGRQATLTEYLIGTVYQLYKWILSTYFGRLSAAFVNRLLNSAGIAQPIFSVLKYVRSK